MEKPSKVMWNHLKQLVGKKVTEVAYEADTGTGVIWALVFDDGTQAFILRDPEGNGPGHLEIIEPEAT